MGAVLDEVLAPILRDLTATGGPVARVDWHQWAEPSRDSAPLYGVDGAGVGVAVTLEAQRQAQLVELADQVPEWAVEALWHQQRPATWPNCPRHPNSHPLTVRQVDERAAWVCGPDDVVIASVGALGRA